MDVRTAVEARVGSGEVHGAAWLVDRAGDVTVGAAGTGAPDTIFRISSVTKPVVAVLAMQLVDEGLLSLDDPVDRLLPELAGRRVLRSPDAPIDDTVLAERPVTVRDVLEFRLGLGMDFTGPFPGTVLGALAERGLPAGPPAPQAAPGPDEWMRIVGSVPLSHQPGARWLYNTGAQVLGVLVARAAGRPLPELLAERLLDPLGMTDTGFHVPPDQRGRFGRQWLGPEVYDEPDGQWSTPPAFPDAASGLVSTVADLHAFAASLRTADPVIRTARHGEHGDGEGWGLGIGVKVTDLPDGRHAGSYGWDGGLGSTWWTDPVTDTIAILLTTDAWTSAEPTPVFTDFWRAAFR
ncbi:serine hydrolase domain-containing protein [Cellulomonas humilata]|uniref:CubicO group peptidase (Beta-lactamase class C family) n=1 Tax=Cellulomonas humilata TaxID=144055 RepID=A0ABU0EBW3_9CELL|nr:serine hydrolase domain-containing protein [Cellulomonas humilata]MDQ0372746.1 CubicO group peptidase (beta-lactamase class C family) [Cellulomonas humilata]